MDLKDAKWPQDEVAAMKNRGHYHQAMAICKRGHKYSTRLDPAKNDFAPDKCTTCGKEILVKCPNCDCRIRGNKVGGGYFDFEEADAPGFCDNCGHLFPWATREQRIFELENRLDVDEIDEEDRKIIGQELAKLVNPDLPAEEEQRIWNKISEKAGQTFRNPVVIEVIQGIASKAILKSMGM